MDKERQEINSLVKTVEDELNRGAINSTVPHVAIEYHTKLSVSLSRCYGAIETLDVEEARFFINNRHQQIDGKDVFKSDLACTKAWKLSDKGLWQGFWQKRIERIKVLLKNIEMLYYDGRDEMKRKELTGK